MKTISVPAPFALLLSPELPPTAKLVWLVYCLPPEAGPLNLTRVAARSGLSRHTVVKGLERLAAAGWPAVPPGREAGEPIGLSPRALVGQEPPANNAAVPGDLLEDHRVSPPAKILYGVLQLGAASTGNTQRPTQAGSPAQSGECTYADLSRLTGASINAVKRAVRELVETRWLATEQEHRLAPIRFVLHNPAAEYRANLLAALKQRLGSAPHRGIALLREYLSLVVGDALYLDDSRPAFLVNPYTKQRMVLVRYYPPKVAFDWSGTLHNESYRPAPGSDAAKRLFEEYMKAGICTERGIRFVFISPEDLSLKAIQNKVGSLLPQRDVKGGEYLSEFLDAQGAWYRRSLRWRPAPRRPTAKTRP